MKERICKCGHKEGMHIGSEINQECCKVIQKASYKSGKNRDRVYCSCKRFEEVKM